MQDTIKKHNVLLNTVTAVLIFIIICINTNQSLYYTPGSFTHWTDYLPFLALSFCAFLCSLLLQLEKLFEIYQNKKSLFVRRELIVLGFVCLLLGLEKYLCLLLIPVNFLNSGFLKITVAVFLADNWDIVFMFAAGILFVHAFQIREVLIERNQRIKYLLLYISLIFLIILVGYFKVWLFMNFNCNVYIFNIFSVLFIFICSLILQAEQIVYIFHMKNKIHLEFIALFIIALFLTIIEIWMSIHLYDSPSSIIQKVIGSVLWQVAYSFAAGMFFVRAFGVDDSQGD